MAQQVVGAVSGNGSQIEVYAEGRLYCRVDRADDAERIQKELVAALAEGVDVWGQTVRGRILGPLFVEEMEPVPSLAPALPRPPDTTETERFLLHKIASLERRVFSLEEALKVRSGPV